MRYIFIFAMALSLAMVLLSVTTFAAPTAPAQEVLSQLKAIRAIDISPDWAPDILAGRERIEKMLKAYLRLPKADKASITEVDTTSINKYLDGFCTATKTDKAAYVKQHGSEGTTMPSSSSSSTASSSSAASSSAASSEDETASTGEEPPQDEQDANSVASKPAIMLDPNYAAAPDADSIKILPKKPKSAWDKPVNEIVKIMVTTLITMVLAIMMLITIYYIRRNRRIARQNAEMLIAARVYSHVYRIKSVRRGKLLKKKEYALVGAQSTEVSALGAEPKSFAASQTVAEPKAFVERSAPPPPELAVDPAVNAVVKKSVKKSSQHKNGNKSSKSKGKNKSKNKGKKR